MTSDLSPDAQTSYEAGIDPISYAEGEITSLVYAHFAAAFKAVNDPPPHPDYSPPAMSRRILGGLLDAGWQPPVWPIPEPGECVS